MYGAPPVPTEGPRTLRLLQEPETYVNVSGAWRCCDEGIVMFMLWCPFYPRELSLCVQVAPCVSV
jgi:hypothetical protein